MDHGAELVSEYSSFLTSIKTKFIPDTKEHLKDDIENIQFQRVFYTQYNSV